MKLKMWKPFVCLMVIALVGVTEVSTADARKKADNPVGEEYYTAANIRYEHPDTILSTNFHKGAMIPVGTKVIIDYCRGIKIKFSETETGASYTYIHAKKHSRIKLKQLFARYFTKENPKGPGGAFSQFTAEEKENIEDGTIDLGMSKNATLMAYGYPPTHKTASTANDIWTYWRARAGRILVIFRDGKISDIQG